MKVPIPTRLMSHFQSYPGEYCYLPEDGPNLPHCSFVWRIEQAGGIVGYAWLLDQRKARFEPGWYVMVAIFDEFRGCGALDFAVNRLEDEVRQKGNAEVWAHVNNIRPGSGLLVRRRLLERGYRPLRVGVSYDVEKRYLDLPERDFIERFGSPIVMKKTL